MAGIYFLSGYISPERIQAAYPGLKRRSEKQSNYPRKGAICVICVFLQQIKPGLRFAG